MGIHWVEGGYSADVEIYLLIDGTRHDVAQIGPDFLILRNPSDVPVGNAQIVTRVDEKLERRDVILNCADPAKGELAYA